MSDVSLSAQDPWAEQFRTSDLTYSFDLSGSIPAGDSLAACSWSVFPVGGATIERSYVNGAVASLRVTGGTASAWYVFTGSWISNSGESDSVTFRLFIKPDEQALSQLGSNLFPNRFSATRRLAADRLMLAAKGVMPKVALADDYLWEKIRAAESEVGHTLRVPLVPTAFFAQAPAQADIDALGGMPWDIDPGYDYRAEFFAGESYGFIQMRNRPLISVSRIRFAYPSPATEFFDIPTDWVRMDAKYGTIQLVPSTATFSAPLSAFFMQAIGGGRTIPFMMQISYVAGLANVARDYPELIDVVLKKAALKIIQDAYLPSSGSISADGLSQSLSIDMDKHADAIDTVLNGPKGSNGGLMTAIHGIRLGIA